MLSNEATKIRKFWKPKNKLNRTNERHIRNAMKAANIEEHSISYFLYLPAYKADHKKVLKVLKSIGGS
jgi:hypothetical protein